jgi:hypothetical protein
MLIFFVFSVVGFFSCFVCLRSCVLGVASSLDCPFLIAPSVFSNVYSVILLQKSIRNASGNLWSP